MQPIVPRMPPSSPPPAAFPEPADPHRFACISDSRMGCNQIAPQRAGPQQPDPQRP